ncbi:MAG TPA: S8 family serine peptidase, partial [Roseiflexaceae bacterium]|nr:S8 family serine peptidase [Roseiflexaceae bacterium]
MRLRATLFVVTALVFAALAMPVRGQPVSPPAIRLKAATFTPGKGEKPAIPDALTERGNRPAGKAAMYIVQFAGPVEQAWKNQVEGLGAQLLAYIPDYAFKTRMTPEQAAQVGALQSVAWVGPFEPAYKLSPRLPASGAGVFTVIPEQGADMAALISAAQQAGVNELAQVGGRLTIAADRAAVDALAASPEVAWIEPYTLFEKHNEYGGGNIIGAAVANASGYDGSSQIAAVADTGLGGGTANTAHRDIPASRITAIENWPGVTDICFKSIANDGAIDVDSGHGTHVAGSVLSGGDPSGIGKGVAPAARLVFQATENYVTISNYCKLYGYTDGYYLTGLNDLYGLFQQAYTDGARIHSNSWGSAAAGDYTDNSVTADQFIWNNRDFTITFSAGNEGADANNDGVVDNDSIGAPATAKNVITIGASENDRQGNYQCDTGLTYQSRDTAYQNGQTCSSMGGQNLLGTPRQRWGFTANPIADDPTAGNQEQMAAF